MDLPQLPYPPTVNLYWRHVGNRVMLSAKARAYRRDVLNLLRFRGLPTLTGDVEVIITFRAPDRRRRDLDNLPKGLLDALKYAGIYGDDSQIRRIDMRFGEVQKGGAALVTARTIEVQGA